MKMRKRFKHNLSNLKVLSMNMGELVPIGITEVLPGDTIQQRTTALQRLSPLLAPMMHPVYTYIMHFYVPNRLVWEDWEDFITGGEDGADASVFPTIRFNSGCTVGSLADYFGLPTGSIDITVNALPFRAYQLIYNEYFRNKDLTSENTIDLTSGPDSSTETDLQNVLWEKDYFTSAQPEPQLGSEVTIPLGDSIPIYSDADFDGVDDADNRITVYNSADDDTYRLIANGSSTYFTGSTSTSDPLYANPEGDAASLASINDLREAIALQREAEARQLYGASYHELLRYYGIQGHDARLNRPELLGSYRQIMNISEVLQTGVDSTDSGVGTMAGHGIAAMRGNRYRRFIPEHGHIITTMYTRPKTIYSEGVHKMWLHQAKEDFYNPNLADIGMEPILNKELYYEHTSPADTFGYTHRYESYRSIPSTFAGEFRDGGSLEHYHMARFFSTDPALNTSFVECNPTDRIYASTSTDQIYCQVHHSIQARRMVKHASAPGLIRL
jgi:hypothetical protein